MCGETADARFVMPSIQGALTHRIASEQRFASVRNPAVTIDSRFPTSASMQHAAGQIFDASMMW